MTIENPVRDALTPSETAATGRRLRSTEEYLGAVRRMLRAAALRVANEGEWELAELLALQNDLDWAIGQAVAGQRIKGASWSRIAMGTGCRRQSAQERWGRVVYELEQ